MNTYHRECKGNYLDWHRDKVFMEDNAICILVLEPGDIDSLLDYGVSIWVMRSATDVWLLY